MIPDGGVFKLYEPTNLHVHPIAHYVICGEKKILLITHSDASAIVNAGHRVISIGLNEHGRVWTYGPP